MPQELEGYYIFCFEYFSLFATIRNDRYEVRRKILQTVEYKKAQKVILFSMVK